MQASWPTGPTSPTSPHSLCTSNGKWNAVAYYFKGASERQRCVLLFSSVAEGVPRELKAINRVLSAAAVIDIVSSLASDGGRRDCETSSDGRRTS